VDQRATRKRGEPLDDVLFSAPPGLGKTSLAHIIRARARRQSRWFRCRLGSQAYTNSVGERGRTRQKLLSRYGLEEHLFVSHLTLSRFRHEFDDLLDGSVRSVAGSESGNRRRIGLQ
jgi:Holliday junction DNA resolvase RuvB-like protein